jgi:hypothetical protein
MKAIKLSSLTYEILKDIVRIYDSLVGAHGLKYLCESDLDQVKNGVRQYGHIEWRFGSKLTSHSKLWIQRKAFSRRDDPSIIFCFDPNMSKAEEAIYGKNPQILEAEFNEAVEKYFDENGIS